jgi:hypothetical protein
MIDGLDRVLEQVDQPGVTELRDLLEHVLGGRDVEGRFVDQQTLQPRASRVFRLRFVVNGHIRTVVVKRLKPEIGRRTELVARRWLPAIGLSQGGPPLLGSVAERSGTCAWHVYDDLGPYELDARHVDRERIGAALDVIAEIHTRFARHPLLGEVRLHGGDLGLHFYRSNVSDAMHALEACSADAPHEPLRDRLLERLERLRREVPWRAQALEAYGGPETLLHGDLWAINVFVSPAADGLRARLIDWDHAGVGPASYDLSTFLSRFPRPHRAWMLNIYRERVARAGWTLPSARELNLLCETAEYARCANRLIWPAIALAQDHASWAWDMLAEVDEWFTAFEPVLTMEATRRAAGAARR